jgi:hypothetical protein
MRPISLAAILVISGFAFSAGPANAAPLPKLDTVSSQATGVETVGYYRRRGYRPYRYQRPYYAPRRYGYYAPRRYYGYPRPYYRGYGYRPYARPYYRGYGYRRPYYGRRYR